MVSQKPTLGPALQALREHGGLSVSSLATLADMDRGPLTDLEAGGGNLASLTRAAAALDHYVTPYPSALRNKRRWLGHAERPTALAAGVTLPTLQTTEKTGSCRVKSFEGLCLALDEAPTLARIEHTWFTPPEIVTTILNALNLKRFDLDPCSPTEPTVPTRQNFTEQDGGLWFPWTGAVFCNPPYDDVPRWLDKCAAEFGAGRASKVVALVPYRPETKAWRMLQETDAAVLVLHDRLRFGGRDYIAPSVSAFVLWGLASDELERLRSHLPPHSRIASEAPQKRLQALADLGLSSDAPAEKRDQRRA